MDDREPVNESNDEMQDSSIVMDDREPSTESNDEMEVSSKGSDEVFQDKSDESTGNQGLFSEREDLSESKQSSSEILAKAYPRPFNIEESKSTQVGVTKPLSRDGSNFSDSTAKHSATPEQNVKSTPEKVIYAEPLSRELLLRSLLEETSRNINFLVNQDAEVPMMDPDLPHLDVYAGQASSSSHRPVFAFGDHRCTSGATQSGDTRARIIKRTILQQLSSRWVLNARNILLEVFDDMMVFNEDESRCKKFVHLFLSAAESMHPANYFDELRDLVFKNSQREYTVSMERNSTSGDVTSERDIEDIYGLFFSTVVHILIFTLEDPTIDSIMDKYKQLKDVCTSWSDFRNRNDVKPWILEIENENSRKRMTTLIKIMGRLLLLTRCAFQLLLMYIGTIATQEFIDSHLENLLEGDQVFLVKGRDSILYESYTNSL